MSDHSSGTTGTRIRVSGKTRKSMCLWCGFESEWAWAESYCDREAQKTVREHVESCPEMPVVAEAARLRAEVERLTKERDEALGWLRSSVALLYDAQSFANNQGGDKTRAFRALLKAVPDAVKP